MANRRIKAKTPWIRLRRNLTWDDMIPYADAMDYNPNPPQLRMHKAQARFKVPTWGRRCGKTTACGFESNMVALLGGWVMNVAPTYKLADKVWSESVRMLEGSKFRDLISDLITQEGKQTVRLKTGGLIQAFSTDNPKGLVGDGWDLCVFDEAALEEDPKPWWQNIRPALMDKQGSAIFPSTPRGDNWYHGIFQLGLDPTKEEWWSEQCWSGANPINTEEEIESLKENMTQDEIQQEIYANFLGSGGAVFRTYHEVCDAEWQEEPIPGHQYCAGLDLGKVNDYTVLAIWDASLGCLCHIIRLNLQPYPSMMRTIGPALQKWNCPVLADASREAGTVDQLKNDCYFARIDPFIFNNDRKTRIMNQLALAFDEQSGHLLNNGTLLGRECQSEFGAYRLERLPSGLLRMSAPSGKHDDIVCAVALAYECNLRHMGLGGSVIYNPKPNLPLELQGVYTMVDQLSTVAISGSKRQAFSLRG